MKKYISSKKAKESSKSVVNFKNLCFWYIHHSVKKIVGKIVDTYVLGPYQYEFFDKLLTGILEPKKKGQVIKIALNIKSKWERLTISGIFNVENKLHMNSSNEKKRSNKSNTKQSYCRRRYTKSYKYI